MVSLYERRIIMKLTNGSEEFEAHQFTDQSKDQVFHWVTCNTSIDFENGQPILKIQAANDDINTVRFGDYVIKNKHGEYKPCTETVFQQTYQVID